MAFVIIEDSLAGFAWNLGGDKSAIVKDTVGKS